jgi:hypothetical protein
MIFDAQQGGLFLYGGFGYTGPLSDGWIWTGNDWSRVAALSGHGPQIGSQLALDPNGGVIAIGSCEGPASRLSGHTTLSRGTWVIQARADENMVGSRCHGAVATDLDHHVLLIYGGTFKFPDGISSGPSVGNRVANGMLWDGTSWSPIPDGPSPRVDAVIVYDTSSHVFVLFGGDTGPDVPTKNDTWLWDGKVWVQA